jgi:IclR family transcriptional regulator, pca regulon regulatory protein
MSASAAIDSVFALARCGQNCQNVRYANTCFYSEQITLAVGRLSIWPCDAPEPAMNRRIELGTEVAARNRRVRPRTDERKPRPTDHFVGSFARGLSVICAFGRDAPRMTLSQVAARTGLTRAGARRILLTLQTLGYVGCDERHFYLTPKILDLGYSYVATTPLWDVAEPFMQQVVDAVHESCSASVLDGTEIVYILRVPTKKIMTISLSIGSRLPAWCTSMGRILLGDLSPEALGNVLDGSAIAAYTARTVTDRRKLEQIIREDRRKGWSLVNQELEEGLISISVPLLDRSGRIIAAMNVSSQPSRMSPTEMTRSVLPVLKHEAEKINAALGFRAA